LRLVAVRLEWIPGAAGRRHPLRGLCRPLGRGSLIVLLVRLWRPHPGLSQNRGIEGILREDDEGGRVAAVVARARRSISARCAEV